MLTASPWSCGVYLDSCHHPHPRPWFFVCIIWFRGVCEPIWNWRIKIYFFLKITAVTPNVQRDTHICLPAMLNILYTRRKLLVMSNLCVAKLLIINSLFKFNTPELWKKCLLCVCAFNSKNCRFLALNFR